MARAAARPRLLGLTGSIGMGKSACAAMLEELGVPVCDADATVHALYAAGGAAVEPLRRAFGPEVIDEGGGVDRRALGALVVGNDAAMKTLEGIVHPLVSAARDEWVAARHAEGVRLAVLDVPLLFETGGDADVDCVVVVSAPAERQRERVLARPGMTEGKFEAILARQLPDEQKRQRADVVIDTGCAVEVTRAAVAAMVEQQRGMTHRGEAEP